MFGITKFPTLSRCLSEIGTRFGSRRNPGKHQVKVMFQKVLQQASCDGCSEILVLVGTPSQYKWPYGFWFCRNKVADLNDRLPARILNAIRNCTAWQDYFCRRNDFQHSHVSFRVNPGSAIMEKIGFTVAEIKCIL